MEQVGFPVGKLPIRYLGLPLMSRRLRISEYAPLLAKVDSRLRGWSAKLLSASGRTQLISSVIYGLASFWMSAFILPKGCVKRLEALCASYLWSGKVQTRFNAKVAWADVCLPKHEGGLGLRRLDEWNRTLCLKLLWLLFENSGSLWASWHHHHNLKNMSLWAVELNNGRSWTWNKLLQLRPLAFKFIRGKLGNGKRLSFWFDNWSPFGELLRFMGNQGPSMMRIQLLSTVEEALYQGNTVRRTQRGNNTNLLWEYIAQSRLSLSETTQDAYFWFVKGKEYAAFPTSLTWEDLRSRKVTLPWTEAVWYKDAIPRHAFNMWIASLNRLPTRSRLSSWDSAISPSCVLCGEQEETRDHLFLMCRLAKDSWRDVFSRLTPYESHFHSWDDLISWMKRTTNAAPSRLRKLVGQAAIYHLWRQRNDMLHTGHARTTQHVLHAMEKEIRNGISARRNKRKWRDLMMLWLR